jgi:endoglucanase
LGGNTGDDSFYIQQMGVIMRLATIVLIISPILAMSQETIPSDQSKMSSLPASSFVKGMRVGWNVGNSLEAMNGSVPDETAWSNPKITQQLIDSVKAAGFNAIRLPVGWSVFSDAANYTIKKEWLDRVQEVVNYAIDRDMYVVMNEHWDGGWLQPTNAAKETATKRLTAIWKQVAIRFRDYGDHLLFAGTNEVMKDGDYGTPTTELITVQSGYNQSFVNTVRATGGRNAYRYLVVQAFNTNIDHAVSFFKSPTDQQQDRLVMEVHYYDPYEFTIASDKTDITQWGAGGSPSKKATWDSDESHVDAQFAKMKTNFISKGIPVILGEYAAMLKNTSDNPPFRLAWDKYITQAAIKVGMIPFYWDPGSLSTNSSGLFDRNTGKQGYPDVIKAIVSAAPPTRVEPHAGERRSAVSHWLARSGDLLCSAGAAEIFLYHLDGSLVRCSTINQGRAVCSLRGLQGGAYIARSGANAIPVMVQ